MMSKSYSQPPSQILIYAAKLFIKWPLLSSLNIHTALYITIHNTLYKAVEVKEKKEIPLDLGSLR